MRRSGRKRRANWREEMDLRVRSSRARGDGDLVPVKSRGGRPTHRKKCKAKSAVTRSKRRTRFCSNCGFKFISVDANFCANCGTKRTILESSDSESDDSVDESTSDESEGGSVASTDKGAASDLHQLAKTMGRHLHLDIKFKKQAALSPSCTDFDVVGPCVRRTGPGRTWRLTGLDSRIEQRLHSTTMRKYQNLNL